MTRRATGFTIIEVLIAISISAFIGVLIATFFNTGMKTKEVVESEAERYRMLRTAMNRMCREIGAAYVSDRYDPKRYRDAYDRPTNFVGSRDRLLFTSMAHQRLYTDAKESDQMVVEYWVKATREKGAKARDDLYRRENPHFDDKMERGGSEDVLLEGVKKIEFEYWDSDRKEWDDEWDTRRGERKAILPTRVKLTVVMVDETGQESKFSTQVRVMMNTELPRYQ